MRRVLVIAVTVFAALGSTAAMAAWTPAGSGSGTSSGLALGLPTSVAATALSYSSVRVTWAAPGSSPTPSQYVVRRTAPTTATVCTVAPPTLQCDDTGLTGSITYGYTVESRLGTNWTSGQSGTASATTPAGPTFLLSVSGSTKTAGNAFNVTITATTDGVTTDTAYAGAEVLTFSGPASSPGGNAPVYPASVTFTAGVGTASVRLYNAATATLSATDGTRTGSVSVTVVPANANQLRFTSSSVSCTSGSVTVGTGGAFTSKVTAYDSYLNPKPGSRTVFLTRSPSIGTLSPTSLSIAAGNSETTNSSTYTLPGGTPPDVTVRAASFGLSSTTCVVKDG